MYFLVTDLEKVILGVKQLKQDLQYKHEDSTIEVDNFFVDSDRVIRVVFHGEKTGLTGHILGTLGERGKFIYIESEEG